MRTFILKLLVCLPALLANQIFPHMQVLDNLLVAYKARHAHCLNSTTLPPPYVLMSMVDEYAGLGNQFPGIITGEQRPYLPTSGG